MKKFVLILSLLLFVSINSPAQVVVYTETALNAWSYLGHSSTFAYTGWNCTNTFNSTEQVHSGSTATKVVAGAWAGYKIRTRTYGDTIWLPIAGLDSIKFYIYPLTTGYNYAVKFTDEISGHTFTTKTTGTLTADSWHLVHFAISELNTNAYDSLVSVSIEPQTGTANTFYVDNISFTGTPAPPGSAWYPSNITSLNETAVDTIQTINGIDIHSISTVNGNPTTDETYTAPSDTIIVVGYYPGWLQGYNDGGQMPSDEVDWSALGVVIHFSLVLNANGTLNTSSNSITAYNVNALMTNAPATMPKLICVGGAGSRTNYNTVAGSCLETFGNNIITFVDTNGYDGVDVDWESLENADSTNYRNTLTMLRRKLDSLGTINAKTYALTVAVGNDPGVIGQTYILNKITWINLMSYDIANGAWPGWVVWHDSPLSNGGRTFPSTGQPIPSCESWYNGYISAGVPASKMSIGSDWYGYRWYGGAGMPNGGPTDPMDEWTSAPSVAAQSAFYLMMPTYWDTTRYAWDSLSSASYLRRDSTDNADDFFISIDLQPDIAAKVAWCKSNNARLIIWAIGADYKSAGWSLAHTPSWWSGETAPLLNAVKVANKGP